MGNIDLALLHAIKIEGWGTASSSLPSL